VGRYGRLDILVNNAAAPQGLDRRDITEVPIDVWDHVIRVNLRGTFLMSRFAIPVMRGQRSGRIVNISSMAGVVAVPRSAAYSASKAAVIALTRSMALDAAAWGITVNAICPGAVGTSRAILSEDPDLDVAAELERRGRNIPVGRVGRPEDIAAAVAYLVDAGADYMTGQILVLDGGGHSAFPVPRPPDPE
jgi:3-oxoacyl-[acyl-carrier protein] reductase